MWGWGGSQSRHPQPGCLQLAGSEGCRSRGGTLAAQWAPTVRAEPSHRWEKRDPPNHGDEMQPPPS